MDAETKAYSEWMATGEWYDGGTQAGFHAGYHARDAEIEGLKAGVREIMDIAVKYRYAGISSICDLLLKGRY